MTWHIATSEEGTYYGDFPTKEDAIDEGKAAGYDVFYVGQAREPKPLSTAIFASEVVERAQESLDDWDPEFANFRPTKEQLKTLEEELRLVVDRWFDQYRLHPTWFVVDNVERIDVEAAPE